MQIRRARRAGHQRRPHFLGCRLWLHTTPVRPAAPLCIRTPSRRSEDAGYSARRLSGQPRAFPARAIMDVPQSNKGRGRSGGRGQRVLQNLLSSFLYRPARHLHGNHHNGSRPTPTGSPRRTPPRHGRVPPRMALSLLHQPQSPPAQMGARAPAVVG